MLNKTIVITGLLEGINLASVYTTATIWLGWQ